MNRDINVLALAYLGDSIYEVHIRKYLIQKRICNVNELQKEAITYVSAKGQASFLNKMINDNFFTEEEINVIHRGRNHKSHKSPKNTDIRTYKEATGFETLIGYLYINDKKDRINDIMNYILEG
ncbi:MAG: Mini-ribonuclease 3 [Lactobacillales bacterium]|nr:Mini-ribonuclease 3 [Lactobacillales bacterium]